MTIEFRARVAERLGLPATASNAEILAAFDARTAAPPQSAGDRLYETAWGE